MLLHAVDTYLESGEKASAWQRRHNLKIRGVSRSDITIFAGSYFENLPGPRRYRFFMKSAETRVVDRGAASAVLHTHLSSLVDMSFDFRVSVRHMNRTLTVKKDSLFDRTERERPDQHCNNNGGVYAR